MFRLIVTLSLPLLAVLVIQTGEGACKRCAKGTDDKNCTTTYDLPVKETDTFCTAIKGNADYNSKLCELHPKGYKVLCGDKNSTACENTCPDSGVAITHSMPITLATIVLMLLCA